MLKRISTFTGIYAFLSNFYSCKITYEGITYPSVEHAFQATKTLNIAQRYMCAALRTPQQAKQFGRSVTLRADWEKIKVNVMRDLLRIKFSQHSLREQLQKNR